MIPPFVVARVAGSLAVATWKHATVDRNTRWPAGFDARAAGVRLMTAKDE